MKIENQYIIHFKGLKEGIHYFTFDIGKKFFERFEHLEIPDGRLSANIKLDKKTGFLDLDIEMTGEVQAQCDRCLEYFSLPVAYSGQLVVRFTEAEKESIEDMIFLHPDEYELDLSHYLYESISVSLPLRKIHPDLPDGTEGCDTEMMKKLNEHLIRE